MVDNLDKGVIRFRRKEDWRDDSRMASNRADRGMLPWLEDELIGIVRLVLRSYRSHVYQASQVLERPKGPE